MTQAQRQEAERIREAAQRDFPPKAVQQIPTPDGLPRKIQDARELRGFTRYELGKSANVPASVVRAIEQGEDVPISQFHAVAKALGLTLELVEIA